MVYPQNTIVRVDTVLVTGIDYVSTYGFWAQQKSGGPFGGIQVEGFDVGDQRGFQIGNILACARLALTFGADGFEDD
jgi:hypothetical protein